MNVNRLFNTTLTIAIILVYVVIVAGAVVRMTGSGMGCPDWPKCFGYLVPPTEKQQLEWQPNHDYKEGQVIIKNEALRVVKSDFTSTRSYNERFWNAYNKHDYAIFNPLHTWVEYINRLATVLFGIPILLLVVLSLCFWKKKKTIFYLALAALFSVGFEAWLGKIVVDTNLLPVKITLHVVFVFFIIAFLLSLRFVTSDIKIIPKNKKLITLGITAVIFTLIQVVIGTQVRQYIDLKMQNYNHLQPEKWLEEPPFIFYIHRSFSIILLLVNGAWLWYNSKQQQMKLLHWVGIFIVLEICSGITLYYFDFPFLSQPLHLLLSSLLFGIQFFCTLKFLNYKR